MYLAMDTRNINWSILNKRYINRGWLLSFILSILGLNTEGLLLDQYIGCFDYNNETARITTRSNSYSVDHQLTIEKCIATCRQQPHAPAYAALWNGKICHCVDDFGIQQSDDVCKIMCDGNHLEYCGGATIGNNKSSIHCSVYAVCPVGKYRFACDEVCHCKRQIPCHRVTGKCPDGCDGNYTGLSCNISSLHEQYIGCYKDLVEDRALTHRPYVYSVRQTLEMCTTACAGANSSYAGAQFSSECFCGEDYAKHGELKNEMCNYTCSGNRSPLCGGAGASSIYSVCPVGNYGKGCTENCNCLNNTRCVYRNGSCPLTLCKAGWTGTSCNIRDKDECSEMPSVCGQNALNCTNTIGGFRCSCSLGLTMFNTACMTETSYVQKTVIVGAIIGSVFCLCVVLAITVLLYKYRHKRPNKKSTTSGNVSRFGESVVRGTTCTEENNYEVLSRRSDDTNVYQQIAMTRSPM